MAQNLPPPRRPENRSRGPSDASMNRYSPETYPPQPAPYVEQGYRPSRSRGPSFANEQPSYAPYPSQSYGPPPDLPYGQHQRQTSYSGRYPDQLSPSGGEHRLRPPVEPRRRSTSSTHSRRSHDSRRSHRSKRSSSPDDRPRRSHDSTRDRDRGREGRHHHSHDHRHKEDDRDIKPLKRQDTRRPSWGDTIYDLFDFVKGALGSGSKDRR